MKSLHLHWPKVLLLLLLLTLGFSAYLFWQNQYGTTAATRYEMQTLETGNVVLTASANGTLNPVVLVNVGTQVSGTVKKLYVDFNDKVQKGQVLMDLDDSLFQAQVQQSEANVSSAQAALELARANEARLQDLYRVEYISRQELDQAVQSLKSAQAQLALAQAQLAKDRTNLGYTVIRSPVSGVVVAREVDVGQTVAASFQTPTLFKIAQDLRKMQINSNFAEADIGNIREGQNVRFTVDAFPTRSFSGVVRQVRLNPSTQQNVVTYDVVVAVENPEQILMPGMTAYVNIMVAERNNVLLVPNASLRFRPQDSARRPGKPRDKTDRKPGTTATVYLLVDGQPQAVSFAPGITDNKVTEVLSGELHAGDQVVVGDREMMDANSGQTSSFRMRMF